MSAAIGLYFVRHFADYFADSEIIRELCRVRVRQAKKRSDKLFLHRISSAKAKLPDKNPNSIFPPRRLWHRFRPRRRGEAPSTVVNERTLLTAVNKLRRTQPTDPWACRLEERIRRIRERALAPGGFCFQPPGISHQEKDAKKGEYRPIARFAEDDRVIDCIVARYFREHVDGALKSSCLAFRCSTDSKKAPQFHDAFEQILRLRSRHSRTGLWVAECDIKGFFDCVDHGIARRALEEVLRDSARSAPANIVDQRAITIFEAYLRCYSFSRSIRGLAEEKLREDTRSEKAHYKWPEADLRRLHTDLDGKSIGVPQGGALSCLIANCVLHSVDKALDRLRRRTKPRFTYLRYCDDMIILAPTKASCECAFELYRDRLGELRLPAHPPKRVERYGAEFWDGKSNSPYHWGGDRDQGDVPWIQFVGYQVRFDGLARIRKRSLKRHMKKVTTATDELLSVLRRKTSGSAGQSNRRGVRKNARQILHRFRQKLISLSVGRQGIQAKSISPAGMCWTFGYRALSGKRIVRTFLKILDRHRERQIKRVQRLLGKIAFASRNKSKEGGVKPPRHYGSPFSYFHQFINVQARQGGAEPR